MAPMAIRTSDIACLPMHTFLKFLFGHSRPQGMLLDKFHLRMATITSLVNVGNVCLGFGILAGEDIMPSVAIITISCPLRSLHDHLGMKALLVFFVSLLMAGCTVHPFVYSLPALGMFV